MQPRVQFVHLRIPDTWPDSVEALLRIVDQHPWILSPPGWGTTLSTLGSLRPRQEDAIEVCLTDRAVVVKVALLSLPFFQQCAADEIADRRNKPPRQLPCPHLQSLVGELASALGLYEKLKGERASQDANWPSKARDALRFLETLARWYTDLHIRRRIKLKLVTPTQLKRASGAYTLLLESLEDRTYADWATIWYKTLQDLLIAQMRQAFKQHAPAGKSYSQLCIDHMVAVILMHFGLETTGTASQIAERFRKRLRRHKA